MKPFYQIPPQGDADVGNVEEGKTFTNAKSFAKKTGTLQSKRAMNVPVTVYESSEENLILTSSQFPFEAVVDADTRFTLESPSFVSDYIAWGHQIFGLNGTYGDPQFRYKAVTVVTEMGTVTGSNIQLFVDFDLDFFMLDIGELGFMEVSVGFDSANYISINTFTNPNIGLCPTCSAYRYTNGTLIVNDSFSAVAIAGAFVNMGMSSSASDRPRIEDGHMKFTLNILGSGFTLGVVGTAIPVNIRLYKA